MGLANVRAAFVTVADMSEGKKLEQLIERHKINKAVFARACGVTPSAVQKMTSAVEWKAGMWATIVTGLDKLGVDSSELRQSTTMRRERAPEDLRPLVEKFPASALEPLRRLLTAGDLERMRVADYLDGLLKGTPSK